MTDQSPSADQAALDRAYLDVAEATLARVEDALCKDGLDVELDIDVARRGRLLELSFPNKTQIVINLQPPLRELWLASREGAHHFKLAGQAWQDTRDGRDFFELLEAAVKGHCGQGVRLR